MRGFDITLNLDLIYFVKNSDYNCAGFLYVRDRLE
jgi:hypothetical protein